MQRPVSFLTPAVLVLPAASSGCHGPISVFFLACKQASCCSWHCSCIYCILQHTHLHKPLNALWWPCVHGPIISDRDCKRSMWLQFHHGRRRWIRQTSSFRCGLLLYTLPQLKAGRAAFAAWFPAQRLMLGQTWQHVSVVAGTCNCNAEGFPLHVIFACATAMQSNFCLSFSMTSDSMIAQITAVSNERATIQTPLADNQHTRAKPVWQVSNIIVSMSLTGVRTWQAHCKCAKPQTKACDMA